MRKSLGWTVPVLLVALAACGSSATPTASPTTAAGTPPTTVATVATVASTAAASTVAPAPTTLASAAPTTIAATTAAPTTAAAAAAAKRTYDVCAMLTAADVKSGGGSGEGVAKGAEKPDHLTSTCSWGGYPTLPGLFVSIGSYQDRAAVDAVKAQLTSAAGTAEVSGVGDSAVRQGDGITAFKGNVVFGAYSSSIPGKSGASDAVLVAVLKIIETKI